MIEADLIVLATGYEKPDIGFLDPGLFPEGYEVRGPCCPCGVVLDLMVDFGW